MPGTLWTLKNCLITRGGDIEAAKRWVPAYTLPAGTFGLGALRSQLYVFGSDAAPSNLPANVQYQRLQDPAGSDMTRILDVKQYADYLYVIAEYASGAVLHFYNGSRVTSMDTPSGTDASLAAVANRLSELISRNPSVTAWAVGNSIIVNSNTAGVPFSISAGAVDGGGTADESASTSTVQPNVVAVPETLASATILINGGSNQPGVNTISSVLLNATPLTYSSVDWVVSNEATASSLAGQINLLSASHGYLANAVGSLVTIYAPVGSGSTRNGYVLSVTVGGSVSVTPTNMGGGVDSVDAVAQVTRVDLAGTVEAADTYSVTVNGTTYSTTTRGASTGRYAFVGKKRVWTVHNTLARYCKLNDATNWTDSDASSGAGFINLSSDTAGNEELTAVADYNSYAAFFSLSQIRVYQIAADMQQTQFVQTLPNTGTQSPRSVVSYGNNDVFYLDFTGIRSIRARDASKAAYTFDIGTAVDPLVQEWMQSLTHEKIARAVGIIEPNDGRYMLAIGSRIFVFSNFPGAKIAAWSYLEPGFEVSDFCRARFNELYARSGDVIYLYGGNENIGTGTSDQYPEPGELEYSIETPFMAASDPGSMKNVRGFDVACDGEWQVNLLVDPLDESKSVNIGKVTGYTYSDANITVPGRGSRFAVNMTSTKGGLASVSDLTIYFDKDETR